MISLFNLNVYVEDEFLDNIFVDKSSVRIQNQKLVS